LEEVIMPIEVVNIRKVGKPDPTKPWEVYIGRAGYGLVGSPLGNPYSVQAYGRDRAISLFEWDIRAAVDALPDVNGRGAKAMNELAAEVRRLKDLYQEHRKLRLFCWCTPSACHGDTIKNIVLDHIDLAEAENYLP
jgi:hypothetical protein